MTLERIMYPIRRRTALLLASCLLTASLQAAESHVMTETAAAVKKTGKAIGHGSRDITRQIGHGTRDASKAIGHGTRDIVREFKKDIKKGFNSAD